MLNKKLKLVLMWHMHQPYYRAGKEDKSRLPWLYLHAIKDYTDMAAHLEANPQSRAVVNFSAILLEQIEDYQQQFDAYFQNQTPFKDALLNILAGIETVGEDLEEREKLVSDVLRLYRPRLLDPFPVFRHLIFEVLAWETPDAKKRLPYLNEQFFLDIVTWYHLVWTGESLRRAEPNIIGLMKKGKNFNQSDRQSLLKIFQKVFNDLIGRYRALMEKGQIELSMTPYAHPIVPLLIDFHAMDCAQPNDPKPHYNAYLGGDERVDEHFARGEALFQKHFGLSPTGIWLSEGGISPEAIEKLEQYQYRWTASGQKVWANSCRQSGLDPHEPSHPNLFHPYRLQGYQPTLFFRDDGLSDLIGFKYQSWTAADAVGDFIHHLENIYEAYQHEVEEPVVSVILDGENAWEYYPQNGWDFLNLLYDRLSQHPYIEMSTFEQVELEHKTPYQLPEFCSGSWVYGSFSTWIGSVEKNLAWERLIEAKWVYDKKWPSLSETQQKKASKQLAICESSDWFWWFGDYNPAGPVKDFDALYRLHLKTLYELLEESPPAILDEPIAYGSAQSAEGNSGTMRANT